MQVNMDIAEAREGEVLIVAPSGRLDSASSPVLEDRLKQKIGSGEAKSVLLDLAELAYMSSAGMRVLMLAARSSKSRGVGFALCGVQPEVAQILAMSGMDRLYTFYDDRAAGVAGMA